MTIAEGIQPVPDHQGLALATIQAILRSVLAPACFAHSYLLHYPLHTVGICCFPHHGMTQSHCQHASNSGLHSPDAQHNMFRQKGPTMAVPGVPQQVNCMCMVLQGHDVSRGTASIDGLLQLHPKQLEAEVWRSPSATKCVISQSSAQYRLGVHQVLAAAYCLGLH